jgi:hypothetical protein
MSEGRPKDLIKDHITPCYAYGSKPIDRDSISAESKHEVQFDGTGNLFPYWLHTQEMWYGKDNMIEINWTKKTLLVIRKS